MHLKADRDVRRSRFIDILPIPVSLLFTLYDMSGRWWNSSYLHDHDQKQQLTVWTYQYTPHSTVHTHSCKHTTYNF